MKKRPLIHDKPPLQPKEKAEILLRSALSRKALNPVLIRLRDLTTLADYFLIRIGPFGKARSRHCGSDPERCQEARH